MLLHPSHALGPLDVSRRLQSSRWRLLRHVALGVWTTQRTSCGRPLGRLRQIRHHSCPAQHARLILHRAHAFGPLDPCKKAAEATVAPSWEPYPQTNTAKFWWACALANSGKYSSLLVGLPLDTSSRTGTTLPGSALAGPKSCPCTQREGDVGCERAGCKESGSFARPAAPTRAA